MRSIVFSSAIVSMALSLPGCGEAVVERVPVAGTVLIDGEPLDGGTIRFVPEVGRPASSAILADGSFEIAAESVDRPSELGLTPGTYRVQVSSSEIVDDETIRWKAPQHYADFRTSGLEVVVDRPTDDLKIELRSEAKEEADAPSDAPADVQPSEATEA